MFKSFKNTVVNSVKHALELAGMTWTVSKQPIYDNFGQTIPEYQSVVRSDSNKVLGIVKNRYRVIQNEQAFEVLNELLDKGFTISSIESFKDGRIVAIEAKLAGLTLEPVKGDLVDILVSLSTSHDASNLVRMLYTAKRLVCLNGMTVADNNLTDLITARHTDSGILKIKSVSGLFDRIHRQTELLVYNTGKMAKKFVSEDEKNKYLLKLFGYETTKTEDIPTRSQNIMSEIIDLSNYGKGTDIQGVKGSVWGLYNAVTEYTDHHASVKGDNPEESRRYSAIYGNNATLKQNAFDLALTLTN